MRFGFTILFLLLHVSTSGAETASIPSDPQYWRYHQWYLDRSVVEVYVSGEDGNHLITVLKEIESLQQKNISVRRVFVIGGNNFVALEEGRYRDRETQRTRARLRDPSESQEGDSSEQDVAKVRQSLGIAEDLPDYGKKAHLGPGTAVPNPKLLIRDNELRFSPTWKVNHGGQSTWLAGEEHIGQYFSERGTFLSSAKEGLRVSQSSSHAFPNGDSSIPGAKVGLPLFALSYSIVDPSDAKGATTSDFRPLCEKGAIRRIPVVYDSKHLDFFDLLYYQLRDPAQAAHAASWMKLAVPFLEGDLANPYRKSSTLLQEYGRFFDIHCLPTRVHYVFLEGRRFEEYREGNEAWQ